MDKNGDPTFYDEKESKAKEINSLLIKSYNYIIYDKDGYSNLRDDSFKEAFIVGTIKSGEHIDVLDNTNQEWLYIRASNNKEGYVNRSRIKSE